MLLINSILGNAYNGSNLKEKIENATQNHTVKQLFLSRSDMEKSRLRTETDDGTEIGLSFEPGTILKNGDVLETDSNLIIIHQYFFVIILYLHLFYLFCNLYHLNFQLYHVNF